MKVFGCRPLDDPMAPKRDPEEEPQRRHRLIENGRMRAVLGKMQLKASHVLQARRVGRSAKKRSKILYGAGVTLLGLRRQLADRHVFDHAPAQRAHGLDGHGDAPVLSGGRKPLITRQDAPSRYPRESVSPQRILPRERFSPLARTSRSEMSARPSLSGDKRTTYAQCEFFAF